MNAKTAPAPVSSASPLDEALNKMCKKHDIVIGPDFRKEILHGVSVDPKAREKALKTIEHRLVTMYENERDYHSES